MILEKCILTANRCYTIGKPIKPKGVMVHSTGANNPTVKRYVQPNTGDPNEQHLLEVLGVNRNRNDWNRPTVDKCVHAFIGKFVNGEVGTVQTLPWDWRGWHAGTGTSGKSANDTHISFEICEDDLKDHGYFEKVYQEAVDLTAMLCLDYDFDPMKDGVVICHSEGFTRGIASGHSDVMHWWPYHAKTMDNFRRDVAAKMKEEISVSDSITYRKLENVPLWAKPTIEKLLAAGAIKGEGDGILNLSYDFCRTFVVLDRMGKL